MKLSEAILLGSTVVAPKSGTLYSPRKNTGCALGMAAVAGGCTWDGPPRDFDLQNRRTMNIEEVFGKWLLRNVMRPCDCRCPIILGRLRAKDIIAYLSDRRSVPLPREMRVKDVIAHLFDYHVMEKKDWTLDQLVTWVERWEPRESARYASMPAVARRQNAQWQSPESLEATAEWQKTREAFEAKAELKRQRSRGTS